MTAKRIDSRSLETAVQLQRHAVDGETLQRFVQKFNFSKLHPGEMEALLLCRQLATPILADDLAARDAAWHCAVRPIGSLGIVVRACQSGRITTAKAEDYIQKLHRVSSVFVTKVLADMAIEQLH